MENVRDSFYMKIDIYSYFIRLGFIMKIFLYYWKLVLEISRFLIYLSRFYIHILFDF